MTRSTGIGGPFGDFYEKVESFVEMVSRSLADGDEIDRDIRDRREKGFVPEDKGAEPDTRLVRVKDLRLGDKVVLEDGPWEVQGLSVDSFAKERIEVILSNGEEYDMITSSFVEVEN